MTRWRTLVSPAIGVIDRSYERRHRLPQVWCGLLQQVMLPGPQQVHKAACKLAVGAITAAAGIDRPAGKQKAWL
jgi:hypothetical protein